MLSPMGLKQCSLLSKQQSLELSERQNKLREIEIKNLKKVQNSLGLSGTLAKGLGSIPGIGDKASNAFKNVEDQVKEIVEKTGEAPSKFKTMTKCLPKNLGQRI